MAKLDLRPDTLDLELYRGDLSAWQIVLEQENALPIDLTSATVRLQIRETATSSVIIVALTAGAGLVVTPLLGKIEFALSVANWVALSSSFYSYDLEVQYAAQGLPQTYLRGSISISGDVTR